MKKSGFIGMREAFGWSGRETVLDIGNCLVYIDMEMILQEEKRMGELSGKTAVITGGGTGIGKEIALRFHQEGASVVLCGRRKDMLDEAAAEIPGDGSRVLARKADVTSDRDVDELVEAVLGRFGRIDILVNNAGIMRFGSVEAASIELWEQIMQTNLYGPWRIMTKVVPVMRKQGGGSMVNISSIAGHKALPNAGVYCTSKASLQMLSQVAALEWAKDRIRVNLIAPGLVESTELADPIFGKENVEDFYARLRGLHPLGRSGMPSDIAEAALYFASERSSWATGVLLPLDGGRHLATNRPPV